MARSLLSLAERLRHSELGELAHPGGIAPRARRRGEASSSNARGPSVRRFDARLPAGGHARGWLSIEYVRKRMFPAEEFEGAGDGLERIGGLRSAPG